MQLRKLLLSALAVATVSIATAATVYAAGSTDTDDHFSLAAGTTVTGALKTGTDMTLTGNIDSFPVTVKCTSFKASGKVPATGLSVTLSKPPTISGCTDSLGGTDTVTTNQTTGKWKLSEIDAPNDETATEPNTGDKLKLTIPKAGATFSSSLLGSGCVITAAPSAPANLTGKYDDKSTDTVTNAAIAVSGAGCTASSSTISATVVVSPGVHDVS